MRTRAFQRFQRGLAKSRLLGTGNYGLTLALTTRRGAAPGERLEDTASPAWGPPPQEPPEGMVPFQHRSEFEPGRRRGEETSRTRLKEEKGR